MDISRRSLFRLLAGAVVAPKVAYFFAPAGGWQSYTISVDPAHCDSRCTTHLRVWQVQYMLERFREDQQLVVRAFGIPKSVLLKESRYEIVGKPNIVGVVIGGRAVSEVLRANTTRNKEGARS